MNINHDPIPLFDRFSGGEIICIVHSVFGEEHHSIELKDVSSFIESLEQAGAFGEIEGYDMPWEAEALLNLKDPDYTVWNLGNPWKECSQ